MQTHLLMINIPYNCSERQLQEWVESRGIETRNIRVIQDSVAGVSPAFGYIELKDARIKRQAICTLNGERMGNQTVWVKEPTIRATSL